MTTTAHTLAPASSDVADLLDAVDNLFKVRRRDLGGDAQAFDRLYLAADKARLNAHNTPTNPLSDDTAPPDDLPAIVFSSENGGTETWFLAISRMAGWHATLVLTDGTLHYVCLVGGARGSTAMPGSVVGFPGLLATPLDEDGTPSAVTRFFNADDVAKVHLW